ncbi:M20/M25/M40 family metallo-hydrolase [Jeotgalibacillus sp. R-1-5s-1]|uniref:M20/M25/M40 family metallo-hydrolase n=1 Tax=Jeotgalibacillus sp. R-1-5s-1 TaxID=2555897 RepID=UPI001068EF94|nr:M20/M25/M40 family metallo-hydrolase [Jeotgalibacillus sp. R-1-5s-1]TFD91889.1 M20/M25/M40 family metallo-hydrolase [Jeotgalibacillus sp. R-1-5s-1]
MYEKLQDLTPEMQAETLTRYLVSLKSYTGTRNERIKAEAIYDIIASFPYFKEHPEEVWIQEIKHDPLGRKNVWARLKGKGTRSVLFHSHIDTVGTDDFGSLQEIAHDPDQLQAFFKNHKGDLRVQEEARSGDWLFGRGSLDMQSGAAVHLVNLLEMSGSQEDLDGTMLFLFNPDEESEHAGMLAALEELHRMKQEGLEFVAAVNNDFIAPMFDGDTTKYIYTGAAGKVLPCFYIYGREAHVGDVLTSVDPTLIGAELNRRINQNTELAEDLEGEYVLPPACLHFKDDKKDYNVQTAISAHLYFNYFVFEKTAEDVIEKLRGITEEAVKELAVESSRKYHDFRRKHGFPSSEWDFSVEVCTFGELEDELIRQGIDVKSKLDKVVEHYKGRDKREAAFALAEALQQLDPEKKPRVLLFFAPPFLPHNYLSEKNQFGSEIIEKLEFRLKETSAATGEVFTTKRFFPYLADGSFLSLHESEEAVDVLQKNIPRMKELYPVPIDLIRELNIPSINIGVYGRDGHKWTERVYKPYTFGVLPKLIRDFALDLVSVRERVNK